MATDESSTQMAPSLAQPARPGGPPPLPSKKAAERPAAEAPRAERAAAQGGQEPAPPDTLDLLPERRFNPREFIKNTSAFLTSMAMHLLVLIVLGMWMLPALPDNPITALLVNVTPEETTEDMLTEVLDAKIEASLEVSSAASFSDAISGGEGAPAGLSSEPALDAAITEQVEGVSVQFESMGISLPGTASLIEAVPTGTLGDPRAIVDDYDQAMDRITQEILLALAKSNVLVIWLFDQSESMKDDQEEIRDRIERVYRELGLTEAAQGDVLATAIASYGEGFLLHTKKPTSDLKEIRAHIDEVPNDPSGKENTCSAIGRSIVLHADYAKRSRRKMMLICVTDESGERDDNDRNMEAAITAAKTANCALYFLGREAVFGYPYAHIRWVHPQTRGVHWIPIDRGPETAFVEQLQTDGFRRRYDAHPSGFGPYEQSRMAQQTGGIFFMLPSLESNLVRGELRRYELEAMRPYLPDLRAKAQIVFDKDASVLRTGLTKLIYDLNPYNPDVAKIIEMRHHYSPRLDEFTRQAHRELEKAKIYVTYLDRAQKAMEEMHHLRQQEYTPRWQANWDLIHAQLLAYKVRIYELGAYVEQFLKEPEVVPLTKPPDLRLVHWDIRTRKETITGDLTKPYIERSTKMLQDVIKDHPGTPWAARAEWELKRGFGVRLVPVYDKPRPPYTGPKTIPVPKM